MASGERKKWNGLVTMKKFDDFEKKDFEKEWKKFTLEIPLGTYTETQKQTILEIIKPVVGRFFYAGIKSCLNHDIAQLDREKKQLRVECKKLHEKTKRTKIECVLLEAELDRDIEKLTKKFGISKESVYSILDLMWERRNKDGTI